MENTFCCSLNEDALREVIIKISLERVDTERNNSGSIIRQQNNRCYGLSLRVRAKELSLYWITQENSMEFLVQYIPLIYTRLIVHAT